MIRPIADSPHELQQWRATLFYHERTILSKKNRIEDNLAERRAGAIARPCPVALVLYAALSVMPTEKARQPSEQDYIAKYL